MDTIIDPQELAEARKESLDEMETLARQSARRAEEPAKRQAMAEIEATLRKVKADWTERGLVAA